MKNLRKHVMVIAVIMSWANSGYSLCLTYNNGTGNWYYNYSATSTSFAGSFGNLTVSSSGYYYYTITQSGNFTVSSFQLGQGGNWWTPNNLRYLQNQPSTIQLAGTIPAGQACGSSAIFNFKLFDNLNRMVCNNTFSINVGVLVSAPSFNSVPTSYCMPASPSAQFCVAAVPNAGSYSWTLPSGWSISGSATGNCITVLFNNVAKTGNICCRAIPNCGGVQGPITCLSVTANKAPFYAVDITNHPGHCTFNLIANIFSGNPTSYLWKYKLQNTSTWTTRTSTINHCIACVLSANKVYDYEVTLSNSCGPTINTGTVTTPAPCTPLRLGEATTFEEDFTSTSSRTENSFIYPASDNSYTIVFSNSTEGELNSIQIVDIRGIVVKNVLQQNQLVPSDGNYNFSIEELSSGIYFCVINSTNGRQVLKFIK